MTTPDRSNPFGATRREVLFAGAAAAAGAVAAGSRALASASVTPSEAASSVGGPATSLVATKDGTSIFFKDWGRGQPIVFSHGWPLNADAWDEQLLHFAANGYRAIAYDRRGHYRSDQPWKGHDMDTYADDLASLIEQLDLRDIVLVGHSSGGGDVTRYLGRHGTHRVSKVVLASAVPPIMLKTAANPGGLPLSVFDAVRTAVATNRSQYYRDGSASFMGANRPGSKVPQGLLDQFWLQSMQCGARAAHECVRAFSETDFTEDLQKIDVPTLILHGEDDQYVPVANHAPLSAKLVKGSILKIYPGGPHGLPMALAEQFNTDVMAFIKAKR